MNFYKTEVEEIQTKMYEGFEIGCKNCGSKKVIINNTLGYSDVSGYWGAISLQCVDCNNEIEIFDGY